YKVQRPEDVPPRPQVLTRLSESVGPLDMDKIDVVIRSYKAPVVLATVKTPDGSAPRGVTIVPSADRNRGMEFVRQADGRYRSVSLQWDADFVLQPSAEDYERADEVPMPRLSEGADREVTITLSPRKPTWEFLTFDGQEHDYDDYKGKYALIFFYDRLSGLWPA